MTPKQAIVYLEVLGLVISCIWLYNDPDWEPFIAALGFTSALIGTIRFGKGLRNSEEPTEAKRPSYSASTVSGISIGHMSGGTVNFGLSKDDLRKDLEQQTRVIQSSIIEAIKQGDEVAIKILERKLSIAEERLSDTNKALKEQEKSLRIAYETIQSLEGQLPKSRLDEAEKALILGNTNEAEDILNSVALEGSEPIGKAAYSLGLLAESRLDLGRALKEYRKAASVSHRLEYLIAASKMSARMGFYSEGAEWLSQALIIAENNGDVMNLSIIYNDLALIHMEQQKYSIAENEIKISIEYTRKAFGPSDRELAIRYTNLANIVGRLNDNDSVCKAYDKALEIIRESQNKSGDEEVSILINYAGYHYRIGNYSTSEQMFIEVLETLRIKGASESFLAAIALGNIGEVHIKMNRFDNAEKELGQALILYKRLYGDLNPSISNIYNNMGALRQEQGRFEEAKEFNLKALEIRERIYGPMHETVANSCNNIGSLLLDSGNLTEALEYGERAKTIREAVFGPTHTLLSNTLNLLGRIMLKQDQFQKAIDLFTRSISIKELNHGADTIHIAPQLNNLAIAFMKVGKFEPALDAANRSLRIASKTHGELHMLVVAAKNTLGHIYAELGRKAEAIQAFKDALEIATRLLPEGHTTIHQIQFSLRSISEK